jgi:hypothetical protein
MLNDVPHHRQPYKKHKGTHHGACHMPGHKAHLGTLRVSTSHCCNVNNHQCAFNLFRFTAPNRIYSPAEAIHWSAACHLISPFPSLLQPAFQHLESSWTRLECSVVDIPYSTDAKITNGRGPRQLDIQGVSKRALQL